MSDLVPGRPNPLADLDAERAVLGAALLDACTVPVTASIVAAGDFYEPRHALLWETFLAIHARGEPLDVLTAVAELRVRDRLNTVGGAQYLGELTDTIPTIAHTESHARIVLDMAQRRRALDAFATAQTKLLRGDPLAAVRADVSGALSRDDRTTSSGFVVEDVGGLFEAYFARSEGRERPQPTPWKPVDAMLGGGLWPGMYVLVGGTGAGKTQWAVQVAVEAAMGGARVLYLALELSRRDLAARVVGTLAGVPWSGILRGNLDDLSFQRATDAGLRTKTLPFQTECGVPFGYGADMLASRAWTLRPQVVVLDYLQLCGGRPGEDARVSVGRVSYVARSIARDLGAVVLVLSSTARANYAELVNDPAKDPSDLVGLGKESGEIEYAADGVLVLSRDPSDPTKRVFVVAKNRHGPLGRVQLAWSGTAFSEPVSDAPEVPYDE